MYTCIDLCPIICGVISSIVVCVPKSPPSKFTLPCYVQGVDNVLAYTPSPISISMTSTYDPQVHELLRH
jgi:hypothetical protein